MARILICTLLLGACAAAVVRPGPSSSAPADMNPDGCGPCGCGQRGKAATGRCELEP